ncbi:MAG: HAD-IIIC family phosphatase [Epulopiscium sp.]|nr:HAD-IIIC family phosphatase [Candidatus Epulonipiscium sp.]
MKELEYPFDNIEILKQQKKYKKILMNNKSLAEKRIAILSGSTIGDLKGVLEIFLLNNNIRPIFYEGLYNRFFEESVFQNQRLDDFKPDIIYIHTTNKNISRLPTPLMSDSEVEKILYDEVERFKSVWNTLSEKYACPIIQNNFEFMPYRVFGNADCYYNNAITQYILSLNERFAEYARKHLNFHLCDIHYLSSWFGLEKWSEPNYWNYYKYALHPEAIPLLAFNVANIIKAIYGKNQKVIITDLDNTLWGGVIGDDGIENLLLGSETPEGIAYWDLQQYLKYLKQSGVILCICSKNEEEIARNGLNNCNGILKEEDFTIIKANWDEKYKNIKDICEEINLLPESMVFLDDNEMERDSVETFIPEIKTLVLSDPMYYRKVLDQGGYFESVGFTEDDKHRTEFYKANMERENSKTLFDNYNDYLSSLEMKASISSFSEKNIVRVTQLINKTNQFNLTGVRYTQSELETISYSENHITLCSRLTDRFGDNGIVTSIVGEISNPKELTITSWVMSCRVFKRNLEHMMFDLLVEQCRIKGIKRILGIYINTGKNKPANDFYNELGFSKYICSDEKTQWEYIIPENYKKMNQVIEVLKNE